MEYLVPASGTIPQEVRTIEGVPCPETFTDGNDLFGAVWLKNDQTIVLWRLSVEKSELPKLSTVSLPGQEIMERSVEDMIQEVWRDEAWDDQEDLRIAEQRTANIEAGHVKTIPLEVFMVERGLLK